MNCKLTEPKYLAKIIFSIMESTPTWLLQSNIYITIDMIYEDIIGKHKSIRNYLASDFIHIHRICRALFCLGYHVSGSIHTKTRDIVEMKNDSFSFSYNVEENVYLTRFKRKTVNSS